MSAHIFQTFISFFFKPAKRAKKIAVGTGIKRSRQEDANPDDLEVADVILLEENECLDATMEDSGQVVHDDAAVSGVCARAIDEMREEGVTMTPVQRQEGYSLLTKVSGLARKVHDSATLREALEQKISAHLPDTPTEQHTLTRRVPTRWNADFACMRSHLLFQNAVQELTGVTSNKLGAFRLTDSQWRLAEEVCSRLLPLFDDLTRLFSHSNVPLIHEAVPMLMSLIKKLRRASLTDSLPAVSRVASRASEIMAQKYFDLLTDECEVYIIAIGTLYHFIP
ncbi:hypothetical protein K488DRAFT_58439 [Vararia minispora EC-137]|uniref:Uncharacterized protein n=1 Tax=Vararia minispora EC-137 TaxID=1314806 RepID=A0ACB8QAA7_9AGAM|nr:hypothetical protein K488DRAFT_58439 [Vararia minispora EC-137]